jgi:hypothetical protein
MQGGVALGPAETGLAIFALSHFREKYKATTTAIASSAHPVAADHQL